MIAKAEQRHHAFGQFLKQLSSETKKNAKIIIGIVAPFVLAVAVFLVRKDPGVKVINLTAVAAVSMLLAFLTAWCITVLRRLDWLKYIKERKVELKVPPFETELETEFKGGTPCVCCEKLIAPDVKICPFCNWSQPK